MLKSVVTTPINHVLRGENWACQRLQSFTGKTVCIRIPPLVNFSLLIDAEGEVQQVNSSEMDADTTLTLSPLALPQLLARESSALEQIEIIGDQLLADELINIGKQLNLNAVFEHDLSTAIGDIPAHRITQAGEHLLHWQVENVHRIAQALAEYWTEENRFLTKPATVDQFNEEIKDLQHSTKQLEQRLKRLTQQSTLASE
ncbi:SCP2 domain-containing protein [Nitrosomonas sp.]|uniref:ubiquinone biosynthesis accessory factor UbiJ n=1 Tax=Nitrosomonas sp. TaxID=42353 RepID=UPI00374D5BE7